MRTIALLALLAACAENGQPDALSGADPSGITLDQALHEATMDLQAADAELEAARDVGGKPASAFDAPATMERYEPLPTPDEDAAHRVVLHGGAAATMERFVPSSTAATMERFVPPMPAAAIDTYDPMATHREEVVTAPEAVRTYRPAVIPADTDAGAIVLEYRRDTADCYLDDRVPYCNHHMVRRGDRIRVLHAGPGRDGEPMVGHVTAGRLKPAGIEVWHRALTGVAEGNLSPEPPSLHLRDTAPLTQLTLERDGEISQHHWLGMLDPRFTRPELRRLDAVMRLTILAASACIESAYFQPHPECTPRP